MVTMRENNYSGYSIDSILQDIRYLGRLIDFDNDNNEEFVKFQDFLDYIDVDHQTNGNYDVMSTMEMLAPLCNEILISCEWSGIKYNCSDLFELRRTAEGYCCSFNYIRTNAQYP